MSEVISNDRELDVDFIGVHFIIILNKNKEISAFTWEKLLKSYQKDISITKPVYHIYLLWELLLTLVIKFQH